MNVRNKKRLGLWLTVALCFVLSLCLFVGCTPESGDTETDSGTEAPTDAPTEEVSDTAVTPTEPETPEVTDPAEETTEPEDTTVEEVKGWEQDTGIFNEGKVNYELLVETEIVAAYPDDKVGQSASIGEDGVQTLFHTDFSDGDVTAGGSAVIRSAGAAGVVDGVFYMPYSADSESHLAGDGWTTWSPVPASNIQNYKQVVLSVDWDVVSKGNGAWMSAMWGCYVSNYAYKIPDSAGDGLWFSFHDNANKITVYHPDTTSWPAGWADVPVEAGLLSGKHHVNIVCTPDYTTYIYVTAEGTTTERLVCTVRFSDGKIQVYNEANEMVKEDSCTTNSLAGENFTLFVHGGGGAIIDEIAVLGCSKGETIEHTSVTATPTEGNTLGLDITDKTDLVSICYSVWFDAILGKSGGTVDSWHNITEILAGNQEWGGSPSFHYWAKPALGYYSSSNKEVIRTHMTQLYTAGVDFIIIDLTNAGDGYLGSSAWTSYIQTPMDAICDTIMEMRAEGLGTPYVVFWVGDGEGPLYKELYDKYHAVEKWKDCFVYWEGKPFMLTTHKSPEDFPYPDLFTVRSMWGLGVKYDEGQWSFLSINNYGKVTNDKDGNPEQVSVAVAAQETYMSASTAHGREGGLFWYSQWYYAFEVHPKIVTLTWWNEWTAQRLSIGDGVYAFTDNYNEEYSRDIEPMEGGHGDQYYQWMIQYISAYKGGLECPVLVEEKYEKRVDRWLEQYIKAGGN